MEDLIFNEILAELKRLNNNISTLQTVNKQSEDNKPMTTYEYLLQKYGPTLEVWTYTDMARGCS